MHYGKSSTDQLNRIFQDPFTKWPRRFKWVVFFCFLLPICFYFASSKDNIAPSFLSMVNILFLFFNLFVVFWGIKLNQLARRHWHKNYHLPMTIIFAFIPLSLLIFQYTNYCL